MMMMMYCLSSIKTHRALNIYHGLHFMWLLRNICNCAGTTDFCFDGKNEGHRLNSSSLRNINAQSGMECLIVCLLEDECCRSVNYRKSSCDGMANCELLHGLAAEQPDLLIKDENFDHYVLLQPVRDPTTFNCPDSRCLNGGRCVGGCGNTTSFCECFLPYRGKYCEINIEVYPRTCNDVKESGLGTADGEYNLYLKWPECNQSAKIYCADMNATNPKEYATLPTGGRNNYALHYAYVADQEQRTGFEKIGINVEDVSVKINDFRFANSNIQNVFHSLASAGDCFSFSCDEVLKRGHFMVDMADTSFMLPTNISYRFFAYPSCVGQVYKALMSSDRRQWSGYCGGYCGRCWPTKFYLLIEGC